jgi:hypothetical protein
MRLRRLAPLALGLIVVLSTAAPAAAASTVVRHVIRTSSWSTPATDPTGLELVNGQLLVVDSEVDETRFDKGKNLWRVTRRGSVLQSLSTLRFSDEPTDIAADPAAHIWYISDDGSFGGIGGKVFVKLLGPDNKYGTADDGRRSFSTGAFGSHDPEGLAFGDNTLWISDGTTGNVYRVQAGPNGKIEGAGTDDVITVFDLSGLGVEDLEGIEFSHGRLFVLAAEPNADILELDPSNGALKRAFDLSTAGLRHPSDVVFGASSTNPSRRSFYVSDRGIDNNGHPNQNDGKIVEVQTVATPPNLIRNGSFEKDRNGDGRPDSWTVNSHFSRTTLARKEGTHSGRHRSVTSATYSVRQDVNDVVAGETYHFEGYTKIPSTNDTFTYRVRMVWFGSNGTKISTSNMVLITSPKLHWTKSIRNVVAPAGTVRAKVVMSITGLNSTIYVDAFSLTVVS